MRPIVVVLLVFCIMLTTIAIARDRYDFRKSDAYTKLSTEDRAKLEQVHRDFMMLWGALDIYSNDHDGKLPESLSDLVPLYLAELPNDPFATKETAGGKELRYYRQSKDGWGYRYVMGSRVKGVIKGEDNRAWILKSVGLPDFPYLSEKKGSTGLSVCKGVYI